MITKILYGIIFIALFTYFIYLGLLNKLVDFVVKYVQSFNSLGVFFNDPDIQVLASVIGIVFSIVVVMGFKK